MVELIPRQERKPLFGQWFFLIVAVLLLCGVGVGFFALERMNQSAADILQNLESTLLQDTRPQEEMLTEELSAYKTKIDTFVILAARRGDFLALFNLLERSTHQGVLFTSFKAEREGEKVSIKGMAADFFTLEQQRLLWSQEKNIKKAEIMNIQLGQGNQITFEAELVI